MKILMEPAILQNLARDSLQRLLHRLNIGSDGSVQYLKAIAVVKSVIASKIPKKTTSLAYYLNQMYTTNAKYMLSIWHWLYGKLMFL